LLNYILYIILLILNYIVFIDLEIDFLMDMLVLSLGVSDS